MEEMEDELDEGDVEQAVEGFDEEGQQKVNPDSQIPEVNEGDAAQVSGVAAQGTAHPSQVGAAAGEQ